MQKKMPAFTISVYIKSLYSGNHLHRKISTRIKKNMSYSYSSLINDVDVALQVHMRSIINYSLQSKKRQSENQQV